MLKRNAISTAIIAVIITAAPIFSQVKRAPTTREQQRRDSQVIQDQLQQAEDDPKLAGERDRFDEQVNRDLLNMKHQLIQEAMNRMNQRRWDNQPERFRSGDIIGFSVFVMMLGAVLWLIRTILDTRRWSRVAAIQTEVHTKLLEKMSSSQELLAYMETEAGKKFLESSPFEIDTNSRSTAPYSRILLSAQAGVVVTVVGTGMLWLKNQLPDQADSLLIFGILGITLGIGLVVSAFISYLMAKQFGLTGTQHSGYQQ